jgi:hypothetical protein
MLAWVGLAAVVTAALPEAAPARVPAERVHELPGLENVARVAPGLYRGAAPRGSTGLASLRKLGIKTVVNLRHYHGSREEAGCRKAGLDYVRVILRSSDAPDDEDVRRFLEVATDPARQPVYFHCWRGKDRTGVMCAAYRMAVEGWTLSEALAEMDAFGFYRGWRDLRAYAESLPARLDRVRPQPAGLGVVPAGR